MTFPDILMRQEWSAERDAMTDEKYIEKYFRQPSYRNRAAWRMIGWHWTAINQTSFATQTAVLNALTDAQKNANTTRYVYFKHACFNLALGHSICSGGNAPFYSND